MSETTCARYGCQRQAIYRLVVMGEPQYLELCGAHSVEASHELAADAQLVATLIDIPIVVRQRAAVAAARAIAEYALGDDDDELADDEVTE